MEKTFRQLMKEIGVLLRNLGVAVVAFLIFSLLFFGLFKLLGLFGITLK